MGRFLLGLSTGAHATSGLKDSTNHIELIAVKAFRIEPDMTQAGSVIYFFFQFSNMFDTFKQVYDGGRRTCGVWDNSSGNIPRIEQDYGSLIRALWFLW